MWTSGASCSGDRSCSRMSRTSEGIQYGIGIRYTYKVITAYLEGIRRSGPPAPPPGAALEDGKAMRQSCRPRGRDLRHPRGPGRSPPGAAALELHQPSADEDRLQRRRLLPRRHREPPAAGQGKAGSFRPGRGDRVRLRPDPQHGKARNPGLVHRVDAGAQLDPHLDRGARPRRRHGHRLRQRTDEERSPDRRGRRHGRSSSGTT